MEPLESDSIALIQTKLQPPRVSGALVERPSLIQRLNEGLDRKLALVSAPAGFGKTTLVVAWLRQVERPYAWLSLDDNDNDLPLFQSYFLGAIRTLFPKACANSCQLLQAAEMPNSNQIVAALINDLVELPQPLILVMDDYHLIHDMGIHQWLNLLLQSLPESLQIVICSRTDPFFPLSRLRVEGQSVEIRTDDLRFTVPEARQFLDLNGHDTIDSTAAVQLNERVEGWAAGLRLAVLSMGDTDEQARWLSDFQAQSDQFITSYLFAEVLTHQPEPVQDFLLHTALMDRFCVDLYLALVAADRPVIQLDSNKILDEIIAMNLFIVPLDEQYGWYRYHHLFQDMLRKTLLEQTSQHHLDVLHRRAALWFERHGFYEEALEHALAANDMSTAVTIVEKNCHNFLNGLERRTLERWIATLPEDVVWQRPKILTAKAWMFYRHWRLRSMEAVLDRLSQLVDSGKTAPNLTENQFLKGQQHVLRSAAEFHLHLNYADVISHADAAIQFLPASEGGALSTAHFHRSLGLVGQGHKETAVQQLAQILGDPTPGGPAKSQTLIGLGLIHYFTGDLIQLELIVNKLRALAESSPPALAPANWFGGLLNFELNKLDQAAADHEVMFQHRYLSNFMGGFYSGLAITRINQIQGSFEEAQDNLDDLRTDTLRLDNSTFLETLAAFQAYQWWLAGDTAAAYRWAQSYQPEMAKDPLLAFDPPGHLWARIILDIGNPAEKTAVLAYLQANLAQLKATQFNRRKIQIQAQLALVQDGLGQRDRARNRLHQAVMLAQPGGHVRCFVDVGASLLPLLQQLNPHEFAPGYLPQLLSAFDENRPQPSLATATLLTARETEILQLIAAGKSNQEIADDLVISLYTAKRHASNIYNKLTVNSRRQAVHEARELGILS
jgi:LuxR family maltose regulon positive regulatory protein